MDADQESTILLSVERPFNWGIVLVGDTDSDDIPSIGDGPVSATATVLAITVRHAQDIEIDEEPARVRIVVERGCTEEPVFFEGRLDVPSGVITLGDAEAGERVSLPPGDFKVQVQLDDPELAQEVRIWMAPG